MALVSQLDDCYEKFLFSFKRKPDGTKQIIREMV
jgi:hypothetical protein